MLGERRFKKQLLNRNPISHNDLQIQRNFGMGNAYYVSQ